MARLALNKASLQRQSRQLEIFRRFLPSLDLKRRQLLAERAKAARQLAESRHALAALFARVAETLPMASTTGVPLEGLARISGIILGEENVLGSRLPVLESVQIQNDPYPLTGRPHWVDPLVSRLNEALELRVRLQVEERRLELLSRAVRKITQRVNLFDKVLIPRTSASIKRIRIHLADGERAAVVRAKIAKAALRRGEKNHSGSETWSDRQGEEAS
jgi:V/A-type H+-transporting ATPase subunit D